MEGFVARESVDYINMPLGRLDERGKVLADSIRTIEHGPERKADIQRELGHIAFELWCRHESGEVEFLQR